MIMECDRKKLETFTFIGNDIMVKAADEYTRT